MAERRILMGVVGRPHGVRGLMHVHSYAAVPADLAAYGALWDDRGRIWTLRWKSEGIAELTDASGQVVGDRDRAASLVNLRLFVDRERLPPPGAEEFYLADLVGLRAIERDGDVERELGRVVAVHDYGAGTSLEIGEGAASLMLPFTHACVPEIMIETGWLRVVRPDEIEVPDDATLQPAPMPVAVPAGTGQ